MSGECWAWLLFLLGVEVKGGIYALRHGKLYQTVLVNRKEGSEMAWLWMDGWEEFYFIFLRFFARFIEEICYGMNGIEDVDDLGVYQCV